MLGRDECAVVIPCLNEERKIRAVIRGVRKHLANVIVVDDGSSDATARFAAAEGAVVIRHARAQGKGASLKSGFQEARRRGFGWALAMDGDGQHSPSDIPVFIEKTQRSSARMIVGDRTGTLGRMPALRRFVNRWMSSRLSGLCGVRLPDSQCGFRLIHLESWAQFQFRARNFEIESELLVRFIRAGLGVEFVSIQTCYGDEQSKIRPIRDSIRWFRWWSAIRAELGEAVAQAEPVPTPFNASYGTFLRDPAA